MPLKRWPRRGKKWHQKAEWKRNEVNNKKGGKKVGKKEILKQQKFCTEGYFFPGRNLEGCMKKHET